MVVERRCIVVLRIGRFTEHKQVCVMLTFRHDAVVHACIARQFGVTDTTRIRGEDDASDQPRCRPPVIGLSPVISGMNPWSEFLVTKSGYKSDVPPAMR